MQKKAFKFCASKTWRFVLFATDCSTTKVQSAKSDAKRDCFASLAMTLLSPGRNDDTCLVHRHCEERSDEAIFFSQQLVLQPKSNRRKAMQNRNQAFKFCASKTWRFACQTKKFRLSRMQNANANAKKRLSKMDSLVL